MKFVIYPSVDEDRLAKIRSTVEHWTVVNADSEDSASQAIQDADCFFGKITPRLLSRSSRLKWIQSPTASLEHYIFPELTTLLPHSPICEVYFPM